MNTLKFKFGTELTGSIQEEDLVAINKGIKEESTSETVNSKLGSFYKGKKFLVLQKQINLLLRKKLLLLV